MSNHFSSFLPRYYFQDFEADIGEEKLGKGMNMLYRKALITIIPSISDYIQNNNNGYLISVHNLQSWVDKIFTLVEDPREYSKIQQNARNTVIKEYNLRRMSKEYYSMWLRLFEKKNG